MSDRTLTGPEHVREAARLEQLALDRWEQAGRQAADLLGPASTRTLALAELTMRQAQLHASLAQTAAILEAALPVEDRGFPWWQRQWSDVFATTEQAPAERRPEPEPPSLSEVHEQLPDLP
jgi:hypothetical protein